MAHSSCYSIYGPCRWAMPYRPATVTVPARRATTIAQARPTITGRADLARRLPDYTVPESAHVPSARLALCSLWQNKLYPLSPGEQTAAVRWLRRLRGSDISRIRHGGPESQRPSSRSTSPTWPQWAEALTHILTHPSHSPSLHSQLFLASRVPCPPTGSTYPPFLCPGAGILRWVLASVFLPRFARLCLPPSSWRSRCPFQLPPPIVPSAAIEPAPERWSEAELRGYARRQRALRGPMRARPPHSVAGAVLTIVPNVVIVAAVIRELFWVRPNRI